MSADIFDGLFGEQKAEEQEAASRDSGSGAVDIIFDIETGPRPWQEIECFFKPPKKPGEFDPNTVKYGNTKDEGKRREKLENERAKHAATVAGWEAEVEKAKAKFLSEAALSPLTGHVVAIGYLFRFSDRIDETAIDSQGGDKTEATILTLFWSRLAEVIKKNDRLIGHNIFGFDLPFIIRRSWLHGICIPTGVLNGRNWSRVFTDTMSVWGCGIYGERCGLNDLSLYFGGKGKNGDGAEFARLYFDPATREQALAYLWNDLEMTAAVAERLGLLR